ncbi:MAG: sigma 54-interacting transcriptional regulator [Phycisphaerae bacterium]|jgi:transcriptional regulator with GAF, ATPase, and Fis domain
MESRDLDQILDALNAVVAADLLVVLSVDDPQTLRVRAASGPLSKPGLIGRRVSLAERPMLSAIVAGSQAKLVHDEEEHDVDEPDTYAGVVELPHAHTCLAAPLRASGELVGVLTLDAATCRAFSEDQIRAVNALAGLAARALQAQEAADRLAREVDALAALNATLSETGPAGASLVGRCPAWREVVERVRLVAPTPATVLITGATGTGKEQVARAIHQWSSRASGPFVALNCAALVGDLALSELFGHEKGAFTGADRRRDGRFALARGGTLFLDEVAELSAAVQAQLLRVLQERTFERVGGACVPLTADVRLITATHKQLETEVGAGRFREDLFYRLNAFPLRLPSLKERRQDIPLLVAHFVKVLRGELEMPELEVSAGALRQLEEHDWPGNVRELRNTLERAAILASGRRIRNEHLDVRADAGLAAARTSERPAKPDERIPAGLRRLDVALAGEILRALDEADGKVSGAGGAASRLGVKPTTLHSTMKRLGLRKRAS